MAPRDLERTRGEVGPEGEKVAYRRFRIREVLRLSQQGSAADHGNRKGPRRDWLSGSNHGCAELDCLRCECRWKHDAPSIWCSPNKL